MKQQRRWNGEKRWGVPDIYNITLLIVLKFHLNGGHHFGVIPNAEQTWLVVGVEANPVVNMTVPCWCKVQEMGGDLGNGGCYNCLFFSSFCSLMLSFHIVSSRLFEPCQLYLFFLSHFTSVIPELSIQF